MRNLYSCIAALLLAVFYAFSASANPVNFQKVWLEYNVKHGDKMCMAIHVKFSVEDIKGKRVEVGALFKNEKGQLLRDLNNKYTDKEGYVWVSEMSEKCKYSYESFNDFVLYIPNKEVHGSKGKHKYSVIVYVNANGKWYKSSISPTFTMTQKQEYKRCFSCFGKGYKDCYTCNSTGTCLQVMQNQFPPYNYYQAYGPCYSCGGNKKINCIVCEGQGMIVDYGGSSGSSRSSSNNTNNNKRETRIVPCTACNATGFEPYDVRPTNDNCNCGHGSSSGLKCYNKRKCMVCQKIHCPGIDKHVNCKECQGQCQITEEKIGAYWYPVK